MRSKGYKWLSYLLTSTKIISQSIIVKIENIVNLSVLQDGRYFKKDICSDEIPYEGRATVSRHKKMETIKNIWAT